MISYQEQDNNKIVQEVEIDGCTVTVFQYENSACYDYEISNDEGKLIEQSNEEYGSIGYCLRDGLNHAYAIENEELQKH